MKFIPICSSSKGNSSYIGTQKSGIAVDLGCSFKMFKTALSMAGVDIDAVKAMLITHEHSDHIKGLLTFTKQRRIPIYASEGALNYLINHHQVDSAADLHTLDELSRAELDADVKFFPTPHDASSVGYRLDFSESSVGICTDLGYVTKEVDNALKGCHTVLVEANYQPELLKSNPHYPPYLKQRIAGKEGHLSNGDSADFCAQLVKNGTVNLILGHLSQENNTPETAFSTVKKRLSEENFTIEKDYTLTVAKVCNDCGEYVSC